MARTRLQTPNFNLSRRADGYYDIRYTENGKTRNKSTGTKDPKEAEAARARFAEDYRKPKLSTRPTVEEICDVYLAYRLPDVRSKGSLGYACAPLKRLLGPLYADGITQTTINGYIRTRLGEPVTRKGGRYGDRPVGEATVNKELRILRAALNWAGSECKLERTPVFRIELTSGEVRDVWITKDEANRLIDAASPHLALFILIALSTAKRREAILSLTWNKVSLQMQGYETIDFGDDVGNKKRGKTPISGMTRLIEVLKAARAVAKTPYVIEFRGEPMRDVKTAMAAACARAKLSADVSAHVLKHSAITWMIQDGMSFEQVAKFTNTSKDIIERVYGHHSPAFVAGAARALAF